MNDYIQKFGPPGQTRDCIHGQHARKCPICELEKELHEAKEQMVGLRREIVHQKNRVTAYDYDLTESNRQRDQCATELAEAIAYFNKLKENKQ